MKLVMICIALIAGEAHADDTKQALREFGWEGTWSIDCSISNVFHSDSKAAFARVHDEIPILGPATRTLEIINEIPPNPRTVARSVLTVTAAKMVADNKLVVDMFDEAKTRTSETVLTMRDGKMVAIRQEVRGVANREMPAGAVSREAVQAGQSYSYQSAENGVAMNPYGQATGSAVLEKCRD